MKNVEMTVNENILTIKVDLTKEFGPSASGKTIIIATTEGNISIPDNEDKKIGLNVYRKKCEPPGRVPAVCLSPVSRGLVLLPG